MTWRRRAALALLVGFAVACEREARRLHTPPADAELAAAAGVIRARAPEDNAYELSEGKRLYAWFNCAGCHASGGGGMGPPLMDEGWRYGSEPADVYVSIVHGRPNGMPGFGGRIPVRQAWQLTAYVRALAGLAASDAAPGRSDGLQAKPAEQAMPVPTPRRERMPQP
ncbi:MAG: cytochrome c [Candidatus Binatia bacterium]